MWARGLVEIEAELKKDEIIVYKKTYHAVAKDGENDISLSWYAPVTIEGAGKLVTAVSIKRIADSLQTDLCKFDQIDHSERILLK